MVAEKSGHYLVSFYLFVYDKIIIIMILVGFFFFLFKFFLAGGR